MLDNNGKNKEGMSWEEWLNVAWADYSGLSFDDVFGAEKSAENWLIWRKGWREGVDPTEFLMAYREEQNAKK
jgi:hypothetical protein